MKISAANSSQPQSPVEPKGAPTAPTQPVSSGTDEVALRKLAALLTMLENHPEIRPDIVARGRALAADPSYPPPDIINKLAGLIVAKVR
jgi:hypothetical protein